MLVLDIQAFKISGNKFLVKELAAFDGLRTCHYVFRAPFAFDRLPLEYRKQALWLMKNHHSIEWEAGSTPSHLLRDILLYVTKSFSEVYVKGKEKAEFLKKYLTIPVLELPEESTNLKLGQPSCFYHKNPTCICALSNVYTLYTNFSMS